MPVTIVPTGAAGTVNWGLEGATTRCLQECSNGNLWLMFYDGTATTDQSVEFWYSTDEGATWNNPGTSSFFGFTATTNNRDVTPSFYIDQDDFAHAVYKDRSNGFLYYRRGTPNAGRTAWTWSAAVLIDGASVDVDEPTVVAHREGTGWKAHIVSSHLSGTTDAVKYTRLDITSGGVITTDAAAASIGHNYANWNYKRPTIDFRHTGDGKTIDTQPDIFISWNSGGSAVANQGTWFVKATYSAGTWTFGTLRNVESTSSSSASNQWMQGLWDANSQRYVFGGYFSIPVVGGLIAVWGRDLADTTTDIITWHEYATSANGTSVNYGALAVDATGNYYMAGEQSSANPTGVYRVVLFELIEGEPLSNLVTIFTPQNASAITRMKMLAHAPAARARFLFQGYNGTTYPYYFGEYVQPPLEQGILPASETDLAIDPPDPNSYRLVMPTYEVTDTRRRPYVKFHQGLSVVKVNGVWTVLPTPDRSLLDAAGEEGVGWFRGGHTYEVPASLALELVTAGVGVESLEQGYGLSGYGYGTYGG